MDLTDAPQHTRNGLIAMNADKPLTRLYGSASEAANALLTRYIDGESIAQIATSLGISQERIYILLMAECPDEWKKAQTGKSLAKLENSEAELEIADDGVKVSRAREQARLACWRVERTARHVYGQDPGQVQINLNLGNVGERLRELEQELLQSLPEQRNTAPEQFPPIDIEPSD